MNQPPVQPGELLTRFLTQPKNHFVPTSGRVKYAAFLPSAALRTSVYRTSDLAQEEVWKLGDDFVAAALRTTISARADIRASVPIGCGLTLDPDGIPHPQHANVAGWPESRPAQKLLAIKLAEAASCVLRSL